MNILKKLIVPYIGKTIIHFTTHGCQGNINEFDWIGKIIDTTPNWGEDKRFVVQILKDKHGEKRDNNLEVNTTTVLSSHLQNLGGDFFITYD